MKILLSPAKKLTSEGIETRFDVGEPKYINEAQYLVDKLKKKSPLSLRRMMGISEDLAQLNVDRFQRWTPTPDDGEASQAVLMFQGDVYLGLEASTWNKSDMNYAQKNLRILSGLYGMLKPLDRVMPYRLEMGSDFKVTAAKKNLYHYWGDTIKDNLVEELESEDGPVIVNLASNEYSKAAKLNKTGVRVITPSFKDAHNGEYKMMSFFAKKARGMMAKYAVKNKIKNVEDLKAFNSEGYYFNNKLSDGDNWVFTRDKR